MSLNLPRPPEWTRLAACTDTDAEIFFPDPGQRDMAAVAVAICRRCPARVPCLAAGIDERFGVWGATTATERARLRNPRDGQGAPTTATSAGDAET